MSARIHDLVLFGATGYTGTLVSAYLAKNAPPDFKWALAGRNGEKLRAVRENLAKVNGRLSEMEIYVVEMDDEAGLANVARKTKVVCTTVGPFARLGLPLTQACTSEGTHYCDITGEPQFIRRSIDENHDRAKETGAKIVHCCGFDSIPFDLGVYILNRAFEDHGARMLSARTVVMKAKGGFSGGTFESMMGMMEEASKDPAVRRVAGNPYGLNPNPKDRGPDENERMRARYDEDLKTWTAPFVMAAINTRIVRRSNALLGWAYGREFRYEEWMRTGPGPMGAIGAGIFAAGLGVFAATAITSPGRALLRRFLPKAGTGPTSEERTAGFFKVQILGEGLGASANKVRATAFVEGDADPGYAETSKMLSEAAMCLALDKLPESAGVLTPASSMGEHLVVRLRNRGMRFDVEGP